MAPELNSSIPKSVLHRTEQKNSSKQNRELLPGTGLGNDFGTDFGTDFDPEPVLVETSFRQHFVSCCIILPDIL